MDTRMDERPVCPACGRHDCDVAERWYASMGGYRHIEG